MSKGKTVSGNRVATTAKAGKKSGSYQDPPFPKKENQDARDHGQQQFVAKEQLVCKREIQVLMWDKSLRQPIFKTKTVTIPTDFINDHSRKQIISSPVLKGGK